MSLVHKMQPHVNLKNKWIMFDHVKGVKDWTTFGVHGCDPKYYKVIIITICDMQLEKASA
jgi:hypothetical protein